MAGKAVDRSWRAVSRHDTPSVTVRAVYPGGMGVAQTSIALLGVSATSLALSAVVLRLVSGRRRVDGETIRMKEQKV